MLRTRTTERLGITHPVMSAPMGSAGAVTAIRPAAVVVRQICEDAEQILRARSRDLLIN